MQGACAVPCFCSGLFRCDSWVFGLSVSFGSRIYTTYACTQLFVVPYSFFAFCCSKTGVSRSKYCRTVAKDPRPQEPACLKRGSEFIEIIGEGGSKHLQEGVAVGRKQICESQRGGNAAACVDGLYVKWSRCGQERETGGELKFKTQLDTR